MSQVGLIEKGSTGGGTGILSCRASPLLASLFLKPDGDATTYRAPAG